MIELGAAPPLLALAGAALIPISKPGLAHRLNRFFAVAVAATALATAVIGANSAQSGNTWILLDPLGSVFLGVNGLIGGMSAFVSPVYLAHSQRGLFASGARWYYLGLYLFWAALLAVPLVGNLGLAWLLIEMTTGASALLVAYSGQRRALEAGWKYLLLTTLGLTVALLGIIFLYAASAPHGSGLAALDWSSLRRAAPQIPHPAAMISLVLIIGGLAAKIGWAPVHHWLPDAHSEAPAPISAMLSGALLPSVMLIAWRVQLAVGSSAGSGASRDLFIAFGLISLGVSVPFLWRPMAIKRLLAYSSLEHVGIMALGIGFDQPLALAGVILHVWGHALAKSLGFYATMPIFRLQPTASRRPAVGIARLSADAGGALALSILGLSGLPPSPLFFSELLILMGGLAAHQNVVVVFMSLMLALGFIGLASQLIEGLLGRPRQLGRGGPGRSRIRELSIATGAGLLILSALAYYLPGSRLLEAFQRAAT
ncbi:MAG TPA: proton-conducting transporter membrane subunit [Candidatus Nitrosotalea sp.]|nr:proton-conducting transporter membrane subunit [Candidatus Nitrosotalea sp.]